MSDGMGDDTGAGGARRACAKHGGMPFQPSAPSRIEGSDAYPSRPSKATC